MSIANILLSRKIPYDLPEPNSKKSRIVKKGVAHEWVWSLELKLQISGISFSGSKLAKSGQKSNSADKANDLNNSFPTNRNLSTCCWPR